MSNNSLLFKALNRVFYILAVVSVHYYGSKLLDYPNTVQEEQTQSTRDAQLPNVETTSEELKHKVNEILLRVREYNLPSKDSNDITQNFVDTTK